MTPTNRLRFVERDIGGKYVQMVRVLQQWWEVEGHEHEDYLKAGGGWRDVPLEVEE